MAQKILVIDDDAFSAQVLEVALKRRGYEAFTAHNGIVGLRLVQEQQPDLILLDLMLPGIDGYEVLNRIRNTPQTANIPVIVVSAKTHEDDQTLAQKIGANGYITKPYQLADLYALIQKILEETTQGLVATSTEGKVVVFISLPRTTAAPVACALARALRQRLAPEEKILLADLRPYLTEYEGILGLPARPNPIEMATIEQIQQWSTLAARHPEGLWVLYHLNGDTPLGGFSPHHLKALCDAVLREVRYALVEMPLQATETVLQAAQRAQRVFFVSSPEAADLMTARTLLQALKAQHVPMERCGVLVRGETPLQDLVEALPAGLKAYVEEPVTPESPVITALASSLLQA